MERPQRTLPDTHRTRDILKDYLMGDGSFWIIRGRTVYPDLHLDDEDYPFEDDRDGSGKEKD